MGVQSVKIITSAKEKEKFVKYLLNDIKALQMMIDQDMIERGITRIGAEQELCLVDSTWRPTPIILEVLKDIDDKHFTTELAKFNLEINLDPIEFNNNCLDTLNSQLQKAIDLTGETLKKYNAKPILTGILPTIRSKDLNDEECH